MKLFKLLILSLLLPLYGFSQSPGGISGNLELWLKANSGTNTTTNGSGITSWADQSGNGNDASGTGQTTYNSSFSNFNPGLSFTDDAQPITGSITRTNGTASTLFVVGETSIITDGCLVELGTATNRAFLIDRRYASSTSSYQFQTNTTSVWTVSDPGGTTNALIYERGLNIATSTKEFSTDWTTGATFYLGDDRSVNNRFTGEIGEVIYYDQQLSAADQLKIESYLAIKYGITLDNSAGGTAGDYEASDASLLWDASANAAYHNNVAGVGRDDNSELDQQKSVSANNGIVIMDKGGAFGSDKDFILWGSNGAGTALTTVNAHPSYTYTLGRVWKTSLSGTPGTVSVSFIYPNNGQVTDYALLLDGTDTDFSTGATAYTTGATISGDTITFTGVAFTDGMFFTLATDRVLPIPGNVSSAPLLWLMANEGTNTTTNGSGITSWSDQSGNGNTASGTGQTTYNSSFSNFNPGLSFTDDAQPITGSITRTNGTASSVFVVGEIPSVTDACLIETGTTANRAVLLDRRYASAISSYQFQTNTTSIWSVSDPGGTTGPLIYENGLNIATSTKEFNTDWTTGGAFYFGDDRSGGNRLTGNIGEAIYFDQQLSAADQLKVESYLALKYGITLDNTSGGIAGDYVASNSTLLWDASANSSYHNGVIGIARDDKSGLMQKQSEDDTTNVYLATLAAQNSSNAGSFSSDLQFLIMGNNGGIMCATTTSNSEKPSGIFSRIEREWEIVNTNFDGSFSMDLTLSNCANTTSINVSELRLLVDADGNFSDALTYSSADGITFVNNSGVISISGITTSEIPTNSTRYVTLASSNSSTPLPIELTDFNARVTINGYVELSWQTVSESNNDYFTIERSPDGKDWKKVTNILGAGTSNTLLSYGFTDKYPYEGTSYYRLKQTDFDGQYEFSKVILVKVRNTDSKISVLPNPTFGTITITGDKIELEHLKLFNTIGYDVTSFTEVLENSESSITISLVHLEPGLYYLKTRTNVKKIDLLR